MNEFGLGADNLQGLVNSQCPNGQMLKDGAKNVLCKQINSRGYIYKDYGNKKQGHLLDLYSQSNTDGYSWIVRWQFLDDGSIEPQIGATGTLQRFGTDTNYGDEVGDTNEVAVASSINYFWRLDFDIAENGNNDAVEEFTVSPTDNGSKKSLSISRLTTETGRTVNQQLKRSWRILDTSVTNTDGHPVSYHLEPLHAGYNYMGRSDESWAQNDIYITRFNSCERSVSNNSTISGCLSDVNGFLNGQNINGADIVVWYGLSYHHFPRDEDKPYMPTRWDSFLLIPRDWTATSPMV